MKPQAAIFDIDGTLSSNAWRVPLLDDSKWDEFYEKQIQDDPVPEMRELARKLCMDLDILIVTGRPMRFRRECKKWLEKHDIPYFLMFMRPSENFSPGWKIKKKIYNRAIRTKWNVLFAVDDDPAAVEAYRQLGIYSLLASDPDGASILDRTSRREVAG